MSRTDRVIGHIFTLSYSIFSSGDYEILFERSKKPCGMVGDESQLPGHEDCQALTGLTVEHLPRDGMLSRAHRVRKGENIWQPDDPADSIFFLKHGQVAVMTSDQEGREMILRVIDEGEPFGELCFCAEQGRRRQTTARAVTNTEAVEIKFTDFLEYLQNNKEALNSLIFTLCVRLTEAYQRVEILALRNAEERLGRLLLQLASSRGRLSEEDKNEVTLPVSHDELAKLAAMSRPHVTVTMVKLRRHGLVRYERRGPVTVNLPALKQRLNI